jgi:hypothetical protein
MIVTISARKNHLRRAYYSCPFAELVFTYLPYYNHVFTGDSLKALGRKAQHNQQSFAAALRTRNSALCPVAERTRIRRSVEIPRVLQLAMAVTRVREVPALFAISSWVYFPFLMIFASAQTSSERNSISPVSPFDNPKALPKSSAVLARTVLSEFDCLIEHLLQSLARQVDLASWHFPRFLLKRMKDDYRIGFVRAINTRTTTLLLFTRNS